MTRPGRSGVIRADNRAFVTPERATRERATRERATRGEATRGEATRGEATRGDAMRRSAGRWWIEALPAQLSQRAVLKEQASLGATEWGRLIRIETAALHDVASHGPGGVVPAILANTHVGSLSPRRISWWHAHDGPSEET